MTNLEGRVIRRRRALDPPAGVPDDLQLLATLAERLGAGDRFSGDPETVFEELRRASAGGAADYSGISYERIDAEDGVFWPCPAPGHPGTPRLFTERFATPDGRARFLRVEHVEAHEPPDAEYPYVLTTGRVLAQYQSGTQTRRTRSLQLIAPTPARRAAPRPRPAARHRAGRRRRAGHPPRPGPLPRAGHRRDPPRRRLRALPLGRRLQRQRAHRPARSTRRRRCPPSRSAPSPSPASAGPRSASARRPRPTSRSPARTSCPRPPDPGPPPGAEGARP